MGIVHPGARNPNWKGGRTLASNGYWLVRVGKGHHLSDVRGYAYEHRVVAEAKFGRRLRDGEVVHHLNGDKADNRPENIDIMASAAEHRREHRTTGKRLREPGEPNEMVACRCGCGGTFLMFDASGRPRAFVKGHNTAERNRKGRTRG